jgi:hypothetical protein
VEILLPVLRLVHILCGVFWAGTIFFVVWLLEPSTREAGPAGGAVMGQLIKRGYLNILPGMAVLTVVSGGWLYWIVSGGLNSGWGHSPMGTALTVGAAAAIIALIIGLAKMRPAGIQMSVLGPKMMAAETDEERAAVGAEMGGLRDSLRKNGRIVGALLLIAVVGMAVARYL